jgi:hypothetical protein
MNATLMLRGVALVAVTLGLAGCGSTGAQGGPPIAAVIRAADASTTGPLPKPHPHVVEPVAGQPARLVSAATTAGAATSDTEPVGDVTAHAPPLSEVQAQLRKELVAARHTTSSYVNPLQYVTVWERTDQGVDANMPVGAPILAPGTIKILAIEPDWYAGQPLVYWELLDGPDAGKVQFVAEEITDIARPGTTLMQGQPIARYAASGTGIEFGWATPSGVTLAVATTGYEEGVATPAGKSMRAWLNSLGANAGNG